MWTSLLVPESRSLLVGSEWMYWSVLPVPVWILEYWSPLAELMSPSVLGSAALASESSFRTAPISVPHPKNKR